MDADHPGNRVEKEQEIMKYVAYYNRRRYAVEQFGNLKIFQLYPTHIIGAVEVPEGQNIWQTASQMWLDENCPVANPDGYPDEEAAISAGKAEVEFYWQSR